MASLDPPDLVVLEPDVAAGKCVRSDRSTTAPQVRVDMTERAFERSQPTGQPRRSLG